MSFKILFWYWWALAAALLVFEMLLPGVVFLFLAIGAAASGAFLLVVADLSLELQLFVFAIVSVASAVVLRPTLKRLQQARVFSRIVSIWRQGRPPMGSSPSGAFAPDRPYW